MMRMWKQVWKCCVYLYLGLFFLPILAAASAACGSTPTLPAEGLVWPVTGPVTGAWSLDCRTDRGHRGIDIQAGAGRPVAASADGTVSFCGFTPAEGGGMTVTIDHAGGLRTTYLHLDQVSVVPGQSVSQGQSLGQSSGTPLHFGVKSIDPREQYFDPLAYLPATVPPEAPATSPAIDPVTAPIAPATTVTSNAGLAAPVTPAADPFTAESMNPAAQPHTAPAIHATESAWSFDSSGAGRPAYGPYASGRGTLARALDDEAGGLAQVTGDDVVTALKDLQCDRIGSAIESA